MILSFMLEDVIAWIIPFLVLLSHITLIVVLIIYLLSFTNSAIHKFWKTLFTRIRKDWMQWCFSFATVSTLGSLFYSNVLGYIPCELCWYQRILMYPMMIIFFVGLWKGKKDVYLYSIPLSIIGALIAGYHYFTQHLPKAVALLTTCTLSEVNCGIKFTFHYGYISIPLMAFTGFVLILFLSLKRK